MFKIGHLNNLAVMSALCVFSSTAVANKPVNFSRANATKTAASLLRNKVCLNVLTKNTNNKYGAFWQDSATKNIIKFGAVSTETADCGSMTLSFINKQDKLKAANDLVRALDVLSKPAQKIVQGATPVEQMEKAPFQLAVKIIKGATSRGDGGQFL